MKLAFNSKLSIATLLFAAFSALALAPAPAVLANDELQEFISDEVGPSTDNPGQAVDELDDDWRQALEDIDVDGADIEYATSTAPNEGDDILSLVTDQGTILELSLRDIDQPLDDSSDTGVYREGSQGVLGPADQDTLGGQAPKPAQAVEEGFYDQNTKGGTTTRNGLLIDFSDPVAAFGAWFGDLETRSETPALLRVFDTDGSLIDDEITIQTSTEDEDTCTGGTAEGCGNNTTRWIGFIAPEGQPAGSVLAIVGEDESGKDGNREGLTAVGFSVLLDENRPVGADGEDADDDNAVVVEDTGDNDDESIDDETVDQPIAEDAPEATVASAATESDASTNDDIEESATHVLGADSTSPQLATTGAGSTTSLIASMLIMAATLGTMRLTKIEQ